MDLTRRFIFRGNAAAFGGRIVRPKDIVLEASGASVLTVSGGRSVWSVKDVRFGDSVQLKSASTFAEGVFDDTQKLIAMTHGTVQEETLTTSTVVRAEVKELVVGGTPKLRIKSIRASLRGRSPAGSQEPSLPLGDETEITGVTIGDYGLEVDLAIDVFKRYDTRAKLLTAADDTKFVKAHGRHLYMSAAAGAQYERRRVVRDGSSIVATIVKRIGWRSNKPFPGATIDENSVVVPDFGTIYFGEILITTASRRLTMVRLKLGSPEGGGASFGEVDTNGTWSN